MFFYPLIVFALKLIFRSFVLSAPSCQNPPGSHQQSTRVVYILLWRVTEALSGVARLGIIPQSERLLVQILVRAHAWVAGVVPRWGMYERQQINVSLSHWCFLFFPSLPFSLKIKSFKRNMSPGWCGSVDWTLDWEAKGRWFNSQSGHMPGLQARSPVRGAWEATIHWCYSPSLSPSLPLSKK